jgi:hypothetical protein
MVRSERAAPGSAAQLVESTGYAGSDSTVAVHCTPHTRVDSRMKALLHFCLAQIFERSPVLATRLGKLVLAIWPHFKER